MSKSGDQRQLQTALSFHQAGRLDDAAALYRRLIRKDPKSFHALHYLGVIEASRGNHQNVKSLMERSLAIEPLNIEFVENYATILFQMADYESALEISRRGLQQGGGNIALLYVSAISSFKLRQFEESIAQFDKLLQLAPNHITAMNERGAVLAELKSYDAAVASFEKVLAVQPQYAEAHLNKGNVFGALGRYDEAIAAYDKALAIRPDLANAWVGRGNVLVELMNYDGAMIAFDNALALQPDLIEAGHGRADLLVKLARYDDALAAYDKILALKPDSAAAWLGRGHVLARLRRREALAAFDQAVMLKPDMPYAAGVRLFNKLLVCDWTNLEAETALLLALVRQGTLASMPFWLLVTPASATEQLRHSNRYVQAQPNLPPVWRGELYSHDRIRVAYLSADLCEHPVAYQTAGVFEHHDRSRFEVTAISLRAPEDSELYRRIEASFERFIDVHSQDNLEVAELIRRLEIDIVVDLTGFTPAGRPEILARRPAPIQVNYLGYSGTMGAKHRDYIMADATVVPEEHFEFYGERVVWLPDSFMPNDDTRLIAKSTPTRAELHLPETGFVFCCFNLSYKIEPMIFDVWMRLLRLVDGSVLWLRDNGTGAAHNLRGEAARRGVAPERLIFAPRLPLIADHLARHRQADLFLDTLHYNAHATACDALWAGLPVVTCLGTTFAGRVSASLLKAVGLDDLVTASLADYEALALQLAHDRSRLDSIKKRLAHNRNTFPLFDTERSTRHIEAAYTTMWQAYQDGHPPTYFAVKDGSEPESQSPGEVPTIVEK